MMPEPTTAASSKAFPSASAPRRRARLGSSSGDAADVIEFTLQGETAQPRDGKIAKTIQPISNLAKHLKEEGALLHLATLEAGRIGKLQCAVIGWPGQTGQTSPAAASQTVMTKSILGASSLANSSQLFERKPAVGRWAIRSVSSVKG